jgi:hypothetical protein
MDHADTFLFNGNFGNVRSVWRAHIDYYKSKNELKVKRGAVKKLEKMNSEAMILNKSIVFEFYIKGIKTYNCLKTGN